MKTTEIPHAAPDGRDPPHEKRRRPSVVLHGISWKCYDMLVEELAEQHVHLNYDGGELELMPPVMIHERWKKILGGFVGLLAIELELPLCMLGSTTLRREDLAKGLEPDECFYIQNEAKVRQKDSLDLTVDPSPDLAIEIDVMYSSVDREAIYAGLGVPELWRYNAQRLEFLHLGREGYHSCGGSLAIPQIRASDLEAFLRNGLTIDSTTLFRQFQDWVRTGLR